MRDCAFAISMVIDHRTWSSFSRVLPMFLIWGRSDKNRGRYRGRWRRNCQRHAHTDTHRETDRHTL